MQVPLQITFRGIGQSDAIEQDVRKQAARLERFHGRVTGCHVTIELPHQHQHKGNIFRVRIDLTVPNAEIVVGREHGLDHAHEDVYVAIRDAFNAAARRLEDALRRPRAERRGHEESQRGRVLRMYPEEHYGFLETTDGLEVYFHEHSVLQGRFGQLRPGDEIRVVVQDTEGQKGPQASTVEFVP